MFSAFGLHKPQSDHIQIHYITQQDSSFWYSASVSLDAMELSILSFLKNLNVMIDQTLYLLISL